MHSRDDDAAADVRVDAHLRRATKLLDLGCGDGTWLDQRGVAEAVGVDIVGAGAPQTSRRWRFISADLDDGIPVDDAWADGVRANQVIEHIRNPVRFLMEVHRVLRPNGVLVVTTPNIRYVRHLLRLSIQGQGPMTSGEAQRTATNWDDGHIHFFTARDLEWLAEEAGFRSYRTEALVEVDGRLRRLRRVLDGLRRNAIVKGFLTGNLLLIARK